MDCSFEGSTSQFRGHLPRLCGVRRHHVFKFYSFQFMGEYVHLFFCSSVHGTYIYYLDILQPERVLTIITVKTRR